MTDKKRLAWSWASYFIPPNLSLFFQKLRVHTNTYLVGLLAFWSWDRPAEAAAHWLAVPGYSPPWQGSHGVSHPAAGHTASTVRRQERCLLTLSTCSSLPSVQHPRHSPFMVGLPTSIPNPESPSHTCPEICLQDAFKPHEGDSRVGDGIHVKYRSYCILGENAEFVLVVKRDAVTTTEAAASEVWMCWVFSAVFTSVKPQ